MKFVGNVPLRSTDMKEVPTIGYVNDRIDTQLYFVQEQVAGNTSSIQTLEASNFATQEYVQQVLTKALAGLDIRTFTINNVALVASTNNHKSWEYTTNFETTDLIFDAGTKVSLFSELTADGFTVSSSGASQPAQFPVEVTIKCNNGMGEVVIGSAWVNYSINGATYTNINKSVFIYKAST